MRQDICRRPFPIFWRCAKGAVRDSSSCCQKLLVRLSQRFDKLLWCTTHCLTCQIATNASNLFFACLLFFLGHRLCLESVFIPFVSVVRVCFWGVHASLCHILSSNR